MKSIIEQRISESISVKESILSSQEMIDDISRIADVIIEAIKSGGKILVCGNGGSASDALHMAGEIVGRFQKERNPWPAIALNSDVATMTAIANDYGYDDIFSRQTRALAQKGDVLIGISSSGNSENVLRAVQVAKELECTTAALLGKGGGVLKEIADNVVVVPSDVTARIQEAHVMCIHIICELAESCLA